MGRCICIGSEELRSCRKSQQNWLENIGARDFTGVMRKTLIATMLALTVACQSVPVVQAQTSWPHATQQADETSSSSDSASSSDRNGNFSEEQELSVENATGSVKPEGGEQALGSALIGAEVLIVILMQLAVIVLPLAVLGGNFYAAMWSTASPFPEPEPNPFIPKREKPHIRNCTDVWNDLGRPILFHEPGFLSKFDADGDGIVCEIDTR